MAVLSLGYVGERLNLTIRQGATLGPFSVTLKNPDASPVDLTGSVIRGQIRKKALDATVVAELDGVLDANPATGVFTFGLTAGETGVLQAGEALTDAASVYVWDMEWRDAAGRILPLYYGAVSVFREVTRA